MSKIDITSTALEKGLDIAKNFVDKLIMPSVEETGLLLKDKVTEFRFKRQIKMLERAKYFCEKNHMTLKTISLKTLCPLLDYSGLEEDDNMLDNWSILLINMADSEQNLENNVFPHILSQLSKSEFHFINEAYNQRQNVLNLILEEYKSFKENHGEEIKNLRDEVASLGELIENRQKNNIKQDEERFKYFQEQYSLKEKLKKLESEKNNFKLRIQKPINIPKELLREYELSNLIRLGIVKEEKDFFADTLPLEIPNDKYDSYLRANVDIYVDSYIQYIITDLGRIFIKACKEKN